MNGFPTPPPTFYHPHYIPTAEVPYRQIRWDQYIASDVATIGSDGFLDEEFNDPIPPALIFPSLHKAYND